MWRFLRTSIPILLVTSSLTAQVRVGTYCQYNDTGNKICRDSDTIISVKPSRFASRIRLNVNDFSEIAPNAFRSRNLADLQLFHPNPDDCTPKALSLTPLIFNGLSVRYSLTLQCVNLTLQPDTFENFKAIHMLSLNKVAFTASLRDFLAEFRQLKVLKLFHLNITIISTSLLSEVSEQLDTLMVYGEVRTIQAKSFERFRNLQFLAIRESDLSQLQSDFFDGLEQLHFLDLGENKITDVYNRTFSKLTNLEELDLSDNRISEIQSEAFSGLQVSIIDLGNNSLTNRCLESIRSVKNLKSLDLRFNNIETLPDNAFKGMINLKTLILEYNGINNIKPNAFAGLHLNKLNLSYNNLTVIEGGTFAGLVVNVLDLRSNNIREIKPGAFINLEAETVLLCYPNVTPEDLKNWGVDDSATAFSVNSC